MFIKIICYNYNQIGQGCIVKLLDKYFENAVFTTKEFEHLFDNSKSMNNSLSNYVKSGKIKRIKSGLYAGVNPLTQDVFANKFEIASKANSSAYVSYHSALEYHGLANQVFHTITVSSPSRFSEFEFNGQSYEFRVSLFEDGVLNIEGNSTIRVTDLERTVVDCINRIDDAGGAEELVQAVSLVTYLDENKILYYLKKYDKKFLYQKTGFLLAKIHGDIMSQEFYDYCKKISNLHKNYLVDERNDNAKLDGEWQIIADTGLFNRRG